MGRRRTGNIQNRESSWRIRYYDAEGLRHQESYSTREEAERQLALRLGELAAGAPVSSKPNTVLFGELADDVLTDYELNQFKSYDDLETRFRLHIIPIFGRRRASQITTAHIRAYSLQRLKAGAKPGTVAHELEAIRHVFKFAVKGRKILYAPHVPMLKTDNVRTGFFTRDEINRVASFLPEPLASFVRFGFLTGWRYGEIQNLKWCSVDFEHGTVRLDPGSTKNGKGRVFPMSQELRHLLINVAAAIATRNQAAKGPMPLATVTTLTKSWPADPVFSIGKERIGSFKKQWKTACYKAGIPCTVVPVRKGGKKGAVKVLACSRTFHDLRRSAAKNLIAQGIPERVVMEMCGWLTRSVFDRYSIVGQADLIAAREKMDAR